MYSGIQWGYGEGKVGYSEGTLEGTVRVQWEYSEDTGKYSQTKMRIMG